MNLLKIETTRKYFFQNFSTELPEEKKAVEEKFLNNHSCLVKLYATTRDIVIVMNNVITVYPYVADIKNQKKICLVNEPP